MTMDNRITILLADYNQETIDENVRRFMPHFTVAGSARNGRDLSSKLEFIKPDVLLMNRSLLDITVKEAINIAQKVSEGTLVYCYTDILTAETIIDMKSCGVQEVFQANVPVQSMAEKIIQDVMEFRAELANAEMTFGRKQGKVIEKVVTQTIGQKIIASYSPKGGTGKSTLVVNLAEATKASPVYSGQNIIVVDFDMDNANLGVWFGVGHDVQYQKNIARFDSVPDNIGMDELDELLITAPSGLKILPAPINVQTASEVSAALCRRTINILKRHFPVIFIDCPPGFTELAALAFQESTDAMIVVNPEGQSVFQVSRLIDNFMSRATDREGQVNSQYILSKIRLVVNNCQPKTQWDLSAKAILNATRQIPIQREIPYSPTVRRALHEFLNHRKQAVTLVPQDEFSIEIKALATDLCYAYPDMLGGNATVLKTSTPNEKKGLFGMFGKGRG